MLCRSGPLPCSALDDADLLRQQLLGLPAPLCVCLSVPGRLARQRLAQVSSLALRSLLSLKRLVLRRASTRG